MATRTIIPVGEPTDGLAPPEDEESIAVPYRLLGEDVAHGEPWTTRFLSTSDAQAHSIVVAVSRLHLPVGRFSLWIERADPQPVDDSGVTHFAPGQMTTNEL